MVKELILDEKILRDALNFVTKAGDEGVTVDKFPLDEWILAAGMLAAEGKVEVLDGGGSKFYRVRAVKKRDDTGIS